MPALLWADSDTRDPDGLRPCWQGPKLGSRGPRYGGDDCGRACLVRRALCAHGKLLPDNDILIAACALEAGQPLATRNTDHFRHLEGLEITPYAA